MIHEIRIHPAIGIMRVGNAPDDFFIGPERPFETPVPAQGYKNAACQILRQGARFRLYAYDSGGGLIGEVTASGGASISWTVELANTKATSPTTSPNSNNNSERNPAITGAARDGLNIRPGLRTLTTPNAIARFDTGTFTFPVGGNPTTVSVPLGEMRTDAEGRLIVLGGWGKAGSPDPALGIGHFFNNTGWYDDVSDGPVKATVVVGGNTFQAMGAWVICTTPDYAAAVSSVHSLYDHLIAEHWPPPAGGSPSYTNDIYPILWRAAGLKWTRNSQQPTSLNLATAHNATPTQRTDIRNEISALPGGLTNVQTGILDDWVNGNFVNDWVAPPVPGPITPEGLDRAALEACIGAPFYPGIEAGVWVNDAAHFSSRLRIDHATVQPGAASQRMAVPWQADFQACSGDSWWPAQRPNTVLVSGQPGRQSWSPAANMTEMVTKWPDAGFVVPEGNQQVEVERCAAASVFLRTPVVTFQGEQGPGGLSRWVAQPVVFEVTTPSTALSLQIASTLALPFDIITTGQLTAAAGSNAAELRFWIRYQTAANPTGPTPDNASVTVSEIGGTRTWVVQLLAHTLPRTETLVGLVLDRSGSMSGDRGDGQPKIDSAREAAGIFVDAMLSQDAVTVVRYNHDAQGVVDPPVVVDDQTGPGSPRQNVKDAVNGNQFNPTGATSIGDGIEVARQILDNTGGYGEKALLVLTDGNENSPKMIADVSASIDDKVFAVGLGKPENTSAAALQTLTGNHGGYLLVTGDITPEKEDILIKYFLQILAGLSNAEVVLDPRGQLMRGDVHEIPFTVTEAAYALDVYLLSTQAERLHFALRTPHGEYVTPTVAAANEPLMRWHPRDRMQLFRLAIPTVVTEDRETPPGVWHAVILRPKRNVRYRTAYKTESLVRALYARDVGTVTERRDDETPISYSLVVHAYSDLRMRAFANQKSREIGSAAYLGVDLDQWGIPLTDLVVRGEVTGPSGPWRLGFERGRSGRWDASFEAREAGIHTVRIRATGRSLYGAPFEREATRTINIWNGGDEPPAIRGEGGAGTVEHAECEDLAQHILEELLRCRGEWNDELAEKLKAWGLDPKRWREVVERLGEWLSDKRRSKPRVPVLDVIPSRAYRLNKRLRELVEELLAREE